MSSVRRVGESQLTTHFELRPLPCRTHDLGWIGPRLRIEVVQRKPLTAGRGDRRQLLVLCRHVARRSLRQVSQGLRQLG